jgi:hypothetical protein
MNRLIVTGAVSIALLMSTGIANAGTYTYESYPSRDKCFTVKHIPATIEVNTKGQFVQGESKSVIGSYKAGAKVIFRNNPAVYIQTERVVEKDYLTLVPGSC